MEFLILVNIHILFMYIYKSTKEKSQQLNQKMNSFDNTFRKGLEILNFKEHRGFSLYTLGTQ